MRRTFVATVGLFLMVTILVGLKTAMAAQALGWSAEGGYAPEAEDPLVSGDGLEGASNGSELPATPDTTSTPGSPAPGAPTGQAGAPSNNQSTPGSTTTTTGAPSPGQTTTTTAPPVAKTYTGTAVAIKTATTPNSPRSGCGSCHTYSISVTITVSGGKITKATATYTPTPSGQSLQDANKANNSLSASIVTKQTWKLGPVSGATYSANAWEQSAMDAMSKAGLPV